MPGMILLVILGVIWAGHGIWVYAALCWALALGWACAAWLEAR